MTKRQEHPTPQCTARSKQTGQRCGQRVPGGGTCRWHGGASPRAIAAREARLVQAELLEEARRAGDPAAVKDPAELLLAALADSNAVLGRLKERATVGEVTGADLETLGGWLDRVARLAKVAIDSRAVELSGQVKRLASEKAAEAALELVTGTLRELGLDAREPRVNAAMLAYLDPSRNATT